MNLILIFAGVILAAYLAAYLASKYFRNYNSLEERLKSLKDLRDSGQISEEDYQRAKKFYEDRGTGSTSNWSRGA